MAFQSPIQQALQHYPITLALVVMCVGVFALQLFFGVNPTNPTNQSLIAWGANFLPFSLGDAPWRLVTSLFLHIGFMHLLFNMFALYYFGQVAERMFGAVNFLALFLLSGVGGNLLNNFLGLHSVMAGEPPIISAGASGQLGLPHYLPSYQAPFAPLWLYHESDARHRLPWSHRQALL